MKTRLLMALLLFSCKQQEGFEIIGNVENIPNGSIILLFQGQKILGKDTIVDGHFEFYDTLESIPAKVMLMMPSMKTGANSFRNFWMDNSLVKISGISKYLSAWHIENRTTEQDILNTFHLKTRHLSIAIDSLEQLRMKNRGDAELKNHFATLKDSVYKLRNIEEFKIIRKDCNNQVALDKLWDIVRNDNPLEKEEILEVYENLDDKYKNTLLGEGIFARTQELPISEIGDEMIDIELFDTAGVKSKLGDYLGKYILLDFWSAGCSYSRKAAPELKRLQDKKRDVLTILGISVDDNLEIWKETIREDKLSFINLSDGKGSYAGAYTTYGIKGTPNFLINPEGIIIEKWFGYEEGIFEEKIENYMSEMKK